MMRIDMTRHDDIFTKRHYNFLAEQFQNMYERTKGSNLEQYPETVMESVIRTLTDELERTQKNFNKSRFLQACGL